MPTHVFHSIKEAVASLNPEEISGHAQRPLRLILYAHTDADYRQMEDFLAPPELSEAKRAQVRSRILRASQEFSPVGSHDLEIYYEDSPPDGLTPIKDVFAFHP